MDRETIKQVNLDRIRNDSVIFNTNIADTSMKRNGLEIVEIQYSQLELGKPIAANHSYNLTFYFN